MSDSALLDFARVVGKVFIKSYREDLTNIDLKDIRVICTSVIDVFTQFYSHFVSTWIQQVK